MREDQLGWFASKGARLSTGLKMLLILSLGLFPLGLVAILASLESARENAAERREETQARVELKAQRIDSVISRSVITIRAAGAAIALVGRNRAICENTLRRLESALVSPGRFALYTDGRVACVTSGFVPPAAVPPASDGRSRVFITDDGQALFFILYGDNRQVEAVGEFSRSSLADISELPGTRSGYDLIISQNGREMILRDEFQDGPLIRTVDAVAPLLGGRMQLRLHIGAVPLQPEEILMILLPIFMWIAAAVIGWIIVDRLLLKPLVRMQRAVSAYQPGDRHLDLPTLSSPAREIGDLGEAFRQVTLTVASHEADLEAAVDRQTRLVREVHHRVKNNLQVVASLLNLHARGATNEDVAAAYASIQRRVDALAVVHRNHYAELEENRGVALKSLISELGANLRATAPASASQMQIRLDIEPYYVTQDVAVSVAFLITELVEFAMFCGGRSVAITLEGKNGTSARLSAESESFRSDVVCDEKLFERFNRVVTGLSRQLRSAIDRDLERGSYSLAIAVVDKADR